MSEISTMQKQETFSLAPSSLQEAMKYAELMSKSTMVPKHYQGKSGDILVAVQMGAELGLKPIQALQNIAVINGRPSVYGDGLLALVQTNPLCEDIKESFDEETMTAYCIVKRKGQSEYQVSFSKDDAIKAGLWNRSGPWTSYPKRMLQMRARGFALRDKFADVLGGLITAEEARDIPTSSDNASAIKTVQEEQRNAPNSVKAQLASFVDQLEDDVDSDDKTQITSEETLIIERSKIEELQELIASNEVSEGIVEKWCHAGNVETLEELPEDKVDACVEWIKNKYANEVNTIL